MSESEKIFEWILVLEARLEIDRVFVHERGPDGRFRGRPEVLSRERRASAFGRADAVITRLIGLAHAAGALEDAPDPAVGARAARLLKPPEPGMIVSRESPVEDLRAWAGRLERRLGLHLLPEDARAAALGRRDVVAWLEIADPDVTV